jgi:hypothetical protein
MVSFFVILRLRNSKPPKQAETAVATSKLPQPKAKPAKKAIITKKISNLRRKQ